MPSSVVRVPAAAFRSVVSEPSVVVIDVRTAAEFTEGHIDGAINIDLGGADFDAEIDALDRGVHYALYCKSDNRSGQAVAIMVEAGFATITELDDGIASWIEAGYPTVES